MTGRAVLIISRSAETRLLLRTLLEVWHYRVIEGRSIGEAVRRSQSGGCPDSILLDGDAALSETLADLRGLRRSELLRRVPVIVISSYAASEYRKRTLAGGATDFFTKPVNYSHLEISLRRCAAPENNMGDFY